MGEIAEDMIEGGCCQWCGAYFEDKKHKQGYTHGYSVVCKPCYDENPKLAKQAGLQRALVDTF